MGVTFEKDFKGQIIRPKDLETLFEINPNHKAYTKNCLLYTSPSPRDRG